MILKNKALLRNIWLNAIQMLGLALVFTGNPVHAAQSGPAKPSEPLFTVLNPTGVAPPIQLKSLAARPGSLDGKTVYLVDVTFNGGDLLLNQMQQWFAAKMPAVKTEFRVKRGGYGTDDPDLWKEIQAVHGLMIMAIGH